MTNIEKQLLLKELCARAPHGVICQFIWTFSNETTNGEDVITKGDDIIRCIDICTEEIQANYYGEWVDLEHCKPYLRPMSSMTEEERKEYESIFSIGEYSCGGSLEGEEYEYINDSYDDVTQSVFLIDWLLAHHFDFRKLIQKGLALEASEDMYKTQ